jgi:hypothetical protein
VTDGSRFKKKSARLIFNSKWVYFYRIKGQDMPLELRIQVRKIISFRWRPSFWMQFSIFRLKSYIAQANCPWSIMRISFRMAPPDKEITWWQVRRPWGPWHIADTRNEAPGEHVLKNIHWCVHNVSCGNILLKIKHFLYDRSTAVGPSDGTISSGGLKTAFGRMVFT